MIAGCYYMHLYCQHTDCLPLSEQHPNHRVQAKDEVDGQTEGECIKKAKKRGWKFSRNADGMKDVTCRNCVAKGRK